MTDMADNPELRTSERGPGPVLAAARTAQNLTLSDVARQLKLSATQVAALEAGQYERLPGPVFVRGFVRNYARLLKMDADRLLAMVADIPGLEATNRMPTTRGVPFPSGSVRRWPRTLLLFALLAVVMLGAYEFYWRERTEATAPAAPAPSPPAASVAKSAPATPVTMAQPEAPATPAAAAPAPPPTAVSEPAPPGTASLAAPESATPAAPPAEPVLYFKFARDSWVQVRDGDGNAIFTRLNPAGTEQRVTGKPPFRLVIGNARGVALSYNDRPVDLASHTVRDDVARLTVE
jgi:cytoskeleton protein RodZ